MALLSVLLAVILLKGTAGELTEGAVYVAMIMCFMFLVFQINYGTSSTPWVLLQRGKMRSISIF